MKNILFIQLFFLALGIVGPSATPIAVSTDPPLPLLLGTIEIRHDLTIRLIPKERHMEGVDRITFIPKGGGAGKKGEGQGGRSSSPSFLLNAKLKVTAVREGERPLPFSTEADEDDPYLQWLRIAPFSPALGKEAPLEIAYEGEIYEPLQAKGPLSFVGPSQTRGMISEEGVYLPPDSGWYPTLRGVHFSAFSLTVRTGPGLEVISQDHLISREMEGEDRLTVWRTERPTPALTLIAGPYVVQSRKVDQVTLSTYFYPDESALSEEYLTAAAEYLEFYQAILGPYPFSVFSIVEGFFPVGEGFPAFTVMGREVIKRHYTQAATLGHELVHAWLGNDVFPEAGGGNWSEGLTTYLANYFYPESRQGEEAARPLRREMQERYALYADSDLEYPLASFVEREGPVDDAVGYQKTALVFHMLRRYLGDALFAKGLKYFVQKEGAQEAGWKEIEKDFERATGKELGWFFRQWVTRTGAPSLQLTEVRKERVNGKYRLRMTLEQKGAPYRLRVPFRIEFEKGSAMKSVESASPITLIDWSFQEAPISVEADPDHDLLRKLSPEEMPYSLNRFLADPRGILLVSDPQYDKMAERVEGIAPKEKKDRLPIASGARSLFFLGLRPDEASYLPKGIAVEFGEDQTRAKSFTILGRRYQEPGDAFLWSAPHPQGGDRGVTFFVALAPETVDSLAPRLFFYGGEGYVIWRQGRPVERGATTELKSPLKYILQGE